MEHTVVHVCRSTVMKLKTENGVTNHISSTGDRIPIQVHPSLRARERLGIDIPRQCDLGGTDILVDHNILQHLGPPCRCGDGLVLSAREGDGAGAGGPVYGTHGLCKCEVAHKFKVVISRIINSG